MALSRATRSANPTILYDQAVENTVEPVVIAMSSAFNAFPTGAQAAGPPPRKTVEYGTGIVVTDDGSIVTDRQLVDGCAAIAIAGFGNADRIAEDKERDLALLRIYGARGLKPLNLAGGNGKTSVDVTGIADPQSQGGGNAVSTIKTAVNGTDLSPDTRDRFLRRRGGGCRRQVRRVSRRFKPDLGRGPRLRSRAGGARAGRCHQGFPQGQWRKAVGHVGGCKGLRRACDLRAEVTPLTSPRACGERSDRVSDSGEGVQVYSTIQ